MMRIEFRVEGVPVAKAKKMTVLGGHARGYIDAKTRNYQDEVRHAAIQVRPEEPIDGPVLLKVVAVFPRTKRLLERSRRTGLLLHADEGRMPCDKKPDLSNVIKAVEDGINNSGIWWDDAQVAGYAEGTGKFWAAVGELPHLVVEIREYAGE